MNERLIFLYVLCLILPALVNKRLSLLYLLSSRVFCFLHLLLQHGQRGIQPLISIRANAVCVKLTRMPSKRQRTADGNGPNTPATAERTSRGHEVRKQIGHRPS
tara:strand:- start:1296 stop:1607 length:312 start_codon:yes stop_codon:yes gene_type:complete